MAYLWNNDVHTCGDEALVPATQSLWYDGVIQHRKRIASNALWVTGLVTVHDLHWHKIGSVMGQIIQSVSEEQW